MYVDDSALSKGLPWIIIHQMLHMVPLTGGICSHSRPIPLQPILMFRKVLEECVGCIVRNLESSLSWFLTAGPPIHSVHYVRDWQYQIFGHETHPSLQLRIFCQQAGRGCVRDVAWMRLAEYMICDSMSY